MLISAADLMKLVKIARKIELIFFEKVKKCCLTNPNNITLSWSILWNAARVG
jgi:hypothetical protein